MYIPTGMYSDSDYKNRTMSYFYFGRPYSGKKAS